VTSTDFKSIADLYSHHSALRRLFVWARWKICPFEQLVESLPNSGKMVEFGCGIGLFSNLAAVKKPGLEVTGIDENSKAIQVAQSTIRSRQNIQFLHQNAQSFKDKESMDVVAMIDVIHHVPRKYQPQVLITARETLKPGGTLILKDIDERPRWMVGASYLHDMIQIHPPYFLNNRDLINLVTSNGFEINSRWAQRMVHIPHLTLVAKRKW